MAEKTTNADKTAPEVVGLPLDKMFPILVFFKYDELQPAAIRDRAKPFNDLARDFAARGAKNQAELAAGLRKLLEARDCFVRAAM
jgi:hypothetical protein